ncbi:thioredoxin reductase (NADPH) [Psychrobacillus sp. OK032]|nr:thioredoxin reductase (NADPH) [Psychrobacillus sp. OK032]
MTFYSTSDRLEIGNIPFLSQDVRPSRTELLKYYRLVTERQEINIKCYQKVTSIFKNTASYTVYAEDSNGNNIPYEANMLVIATGIFDTPRKLDVIGEDLPKLSHYYKEGHHYYGQHVTVIGGKNSAIEAAIDLYRNGAHVTLVHRGETVLEGIKPSLVLDMRNLLKKGQINFYPNSTIAMIDETTISINSPEGTVTIQNDYVFSLIGYQPNISMLQSIGIQTNSSTLVPSFNPETYESNVENVFLSGVVTSGITNRVYIEDGRFHGMKIANEIAQRLSYVQSNI